MCLFSLELNLESIEELSVKLYEATKEELFARLLVRENVGTYPRWDFSREAREARAKRKALWEENKQEIEREALEYVMAQTPEEFRMIILRKLQGVRRGVIPE